MSYRDFQNPLGYVYVANFEHMDCMDYLHSPSSDQGMGPCTAEEAEQAFRAAGYPEPEMRLGLIWVPPIFTPNDNVGFCIWHAKQADNGTSWLCAVKPFPFCGLLELGGKTWREIQVSTPVTATVR